MITNFKIFEQVNIGEPEVGDYVMINNRWLSARDNLINTKIGKVVKSRKQYNEIEISYGEPGDWEVSGIYITSYDEIKYWSKNRDDIEVMVAQQKYNL